MKTITCYHFQKVVGFLLISFIPFLSLAQKHDYIWITGYSSNPVDSSFGGTIIDFKFHPRKLSYEYREPNIRDNTFSICDSIGKLLVYTNGCEIFGADNQLIENGDSINFMDRTFENQCSKGLPGTQHSLILPLPGNQKILYYFHKPNDAYSSPIGSVNPYFLFTVIDMDANNGKGKVLLKNQVILQDTLIPGELAAVKHANGEDWWITVFDYLGQIYYSTLLTSNGIDTTLVDTIGPRHTPPFNGWANTVFSPDGKHYARYDRSTQLVLYEFNRASGLFESARQIIIDNVQNLQPGGLAFSPNSRFLYHTNGDYLYQLDLQSNRPDLDKTLIATYQPVPDDFFDAGFFKCQLAPDCKIYITPFGFSHKLHIIHEPDLKGVDCRFEQHGLYLPTRNGNSLSFHPNYRLGPVGDEGYPCDSTLVATVNRWDEEMEVVVYPNPVKDFLFLSFPERWQKVDCLVFDLSGKQVLKSTLYQGERIDVARLLSGVYVYKVIAPSGKLISGKFLKM